MPTQISSLLDLSSKIDTFFVDVFGTIWDGEAFYPSALQVCKQLIQMGKHIYILSNATTVNARFKEKYKPFGFIQNVHYTDIISSGDTLKDLLENDHLLDKITNSKTGTYYIIGRSNDKLLASVLDRRTMDLEKADAIYIGALQTQQDGKYIYYEDLGPFLKEAKKALKYHLPALCANPDYFAFLKEMKHSTPGLLGKWYQDNGGQVYWCGKPYGNIYDYAYKITGADPQRSAMVGDTIRTDILGGQNAGMKTILILGYGITQDLLNNGQTLQQISDQEGASPDFILETFK